MITVGIDCGSQNTKGVLLKDNEIISKFKTATEFDANKAGQNVYNNLLMTAGINEKEVSKVIATGQGREMLEFVDITINEVISAAKGIHMIKPDIDLLIDMGAESSRVIRMYKNGNVMKYQTNDKCASGAGMFIEAMARALQIKTEEIGDYSIRHTKELATNAQCVVFAESEVISLIHRKESREDIAYGIHIGICNRIASLVRRIGITNNIAMIGGVGHNKGLSQCMNKVLSRDVFISDDTDYISAIGAAYYDKEIA